MTSTGTRASDRSETKLCLNSRGTQSLPVSPAWSTTFRKSRRTLCASSALPVRVTNTRHAHPDISACPHVRVSQSAWSASMARCGSISARRDFLVLVSPPARRAGRTRPQTAPSARTGTVRARLNRVLSVSETDGCRTSLSGRSAPMAGIHLQACHSVRTCGGANAAWSPGSAGKRVTEAPEEVPALWAGTACRFLTWSAESATA